MKLSRFRALPLIPVNRPKGTAGGLFIVGSGRSGTTLLRRLLIERADIYIPPEACMLGPIIEQHEQSRRLPWPDFVAYVVGRFEYSHEFRQFRIGSMRAFAQAMMNASTDERSLEGLLDALYRHFGREAGHPAGRWGDKTPYNTYFLPQISRTFPSARFVSMERDGCDVVVSCVRAGLYPDYVSAAQRWVSSNRLARAFLKRNPARMMALRYEDLIRESDRHATEVMDFAGLTPRASGEEIELSSAMPDAVELPHLNNALAPVNRDNVGQGRKILLSEGSDELKRLMNPMLRKLRYDEI